MSKLYWILICSILMSGMLSADQEQSTYSYVSASQNGRYYFRMIPDKKKYYSHESGTGIMYYAKRNGREQEMWRVSGWYAFRTYPSFRGEYLVRLGNWPRGHRPSAKHLAVAFYHRGKLIKRYSTKDLIRNFGSGHGHRSIGHYRYLKSVSGFGSWNHRFILTTIDDIRYVFNAKTGQIIKIQQL